jgi:long-chain acyl-CoA synthetase
MEETLSGIFQEFEKTARKNPSGKAITFKREETYETVTYGELYERVVKLAGHLYAKGVRKGDRVTILLGTVPEWPVSFFAIEQLGAVAVPLDVNASPDDTVELISHCGSKILISSKEPLSHLGVALSQMGTVETVLADTFLQAASGAGPPGGAAGAARTEAAAIFYTSGTTGTPKGVVLSHENLLSNARAMASFDVARDGDVFISLLPLHHTYAFTATCLLPLLLGVEICYISRLTSKDLLECMRETGVSILVGVPQLFLLFHREIKERLRKLPFFTKISLRVLLELCWVIRRYGKINPAKRILSQVHRRFGKGLRFLVSGGARLDARAQRDFFTWGFTVLEGYGLTETSPIATINPPDKIKIGSVGKAIPGVAVKVEDPDDSGFGEVLIKGPNVMTGYFAMPEETERVLEDGWFSSGDTGRLDQDGYLYLRGRKDEMIVLSSGENINPEEIEAHYASSPYIKEICVFPSKGTGVFQQAEQLVAVVVPDEEYFRKHKLVNIDEKIKWQLDQLSLKLKGYQRIKGYVITRTRLPRTALGKVIRHKARLLYSGKGPAASGEFVEKPPDVEDKKLLASASCRTILEYLSKRLKKTAHLNDHIELDLGIDSLGRVELLLEIQDLLRIKVPASAAEEFFYANTVKELFLRARPFLPEEIDRTEEKEFLWSEVIEKEPSREALQKVSVSASFFNSVCAFLFLASFGVLFRIFCRLEIEGKENLPGKGPFIVYPNHTNYLDGMIIAASLPAGLLKDTFFLGFREVFMLPVIRRLTKPAHLIPIDEAISLVEPLQMCAYLLRRGKALCYFPEGQRSADGNVGRFKKGIGIFAKELNIPLIPAYIEGAYEVWPRHRRMPRPHKIKVILGQGITYADIEEKLTGEEDPYEKAAALLRERLLELAKKK